MTDSSDIDVVDAGAEGDIADDADAYLDAYVETEAVEPEAVETEAGVENDDSESVVEQPASGRDDKE